MKEKKIMQHQKEKKMQQQFSKTHNIPTYRIFDIRFALHGSAITEANLIFALMLINGHSI